MEETVMGLFRKNRDEQSDIAVLEPERDCLHVALTARWDNLDDMGREDLASAWVCQSCNDVFTPAEVARLRATEASRIGANY
jgi:hypothetical protein